MNILRYFKFAMFIIATATFVLVGCNKENNETPNNTITENNDTNTAASIVGTWYEEHLSAETLISQNLVFETNNICHYYCIRGDERWFSEGDYVYDNTPNSLSDGRGTIDFHGDISGFASFIVRDDEMILDFNNTRSTLTKQ